MSLTIGVLGSGVGSNFAAIADEIAEGRLNARVGIVLSDVADAGILDLARARGIKARHLVAGKFKTRLEEHSERRLVDMLKAEGVELVVLAGFMRLLKEPMLAAFPRRIINIHPSLLPKYPGLQAWKQALDAGEKEAGCTVHLVDGGMDTGEIIGQSVVPVLAGDTPKSLHRRIQMAEHDLYPKIIGWFAEGKIR